MSTNARRGMARNPKKRRSDRRVGRTRARLGVALRKLMEERPLEKISVQDVIELAEVSRSAFYAHYDDKVDLLLSDMDEFLERMAMHLSGQNEKSRRLAPAREFFAHVGEAEQIRTALAGSDRLQDFFDLAQEHFACGIEARLKQMPDANCLAPLERSLLAHALSGAFLSLLNWWIRRRQPRSAEQMDNVFHQLAWAAINGSRAQK
jgi:AcrR family transcriptional regulator